MSTYQPKALSANPIIKVVIPARNEEGAIGKVVSEIPDYIDEIIVVDNGSTDATVEVAQANGALTVSVPEPGYGRACLAGIAHAMRHNQVKAVETENESSERIGCDIIVFLDGDASDFPEDMTPMLAPILAGEKDMVIGSRLLGDIEKGSLTPQQKFGNTLACWLMRVIWKGRYTDLGPFRAITVDSLEALKMQAPTFGWTVEMQVRALKLKLRYCETTVSYRKRIGKSKISGTISGVIMAGVYILGTIFKEAFTRHPK